MISATHYWYKLNPRFGGGFLTKGYMLTKFTEEDVWCVVVQTSHDCTRLSQWYTRRYNAERKLKEFIKYASAYSTNYSIMKFTLTEGELIEDSNS